ncbi:MAG: GAF domain-containing protein [Planctomycetes bacterium]|nr:GAF domain-containing protein [Planctomycetota bacterium]
MSDAVRRSSAARLLRRLLGRTEPRESSHSKVPGLSEPLADALEGGMKVRAAVDFTELANQTNSGALDQGAKVDRMRKMLDVLSDSSEALLSCSSLDDMLRRVLDLAFGHLPVERGFIMLWDASKNDLVVKSVKRKKKADTESSDTAFSRTIVNDAYNKRVAILTIDAQNDPRFMTLSVRTLGVRSAMAAPLLNGEHVEGVIYVDTPLLVKAFDEFDLDLLSALANHVAVAIERARLQESVVQQTLARNRLERYHSPAVVERIVGGMASGGDELTADERDVTVLFADMVGFTERCETMAPRAVAAMLNRYLSEMAEVILRHEGTLDKFIGDCVMAVFGAPIADENHARRAVAAALDMREALTRLNAPLAESARMQFRVGIHSGKVIAGDLGSVRRSDFTVVGSTVNLAARIESSVAQPGQIVVSDVTRDAVADQYDAKLVGEFTPKGIARTVRCYEITGRSVAPSVATAPPRAS